MRCNFVAYQIVDGPNWDSFHNYAGETLRFLVTKAEARPVDDKKSLLIFEPILVEPVELWLKVDHVASPMDDPEKIICGEIANGVSHGKLLPEFSRSLGMIFLKRGTKVELRYLMDSKTGVVTFEHMRSAKWLRMHESNSSLNSLEGVVCNDVPYGLCFEVAHYANLKGFGQDWRSARTTRELSRYVETKFTYQVDFASLFFRSSLLHEEGTPIIWI